MIKSLKELQEVAQKAGYETKFTEGVLFIKRSDNEMIAITVVLDAFLVRYIDMNEMKKEYYVVKKLNQENAVKILRKELTEDGEEVLKLG